MVGSYCPLAASSKWKKEQELQLTMAAESVRLLEHYYVNNIVQVVRLHR